MVNVSLAARLARRSLRRIEVQSHFLNIPLARQPILFGNSFPKSGTHLLTQILAGFSRLGPAVESGLPPVLTFEGENGRPRSTATILADLHRLQPGDIAYGHLHASDEVQQALCRAGVAPFFIYRDPRDVVVSHVFYVTDLNNRHAHHAYYVNELADFDARLRVSILGRPKLEFPFPDVRARFEPYLPWLQRTEVLSLRYEDLLHDLNAQLERVFSHALERGFISALGKEEAISALAQAVRPEKSPTFRSGKSGGWKQHFTEDHKKLFKEVTGDLLQRLGYEQNQNW